MPARLSQCPWELGRAHRPRRTARTRLWSASHRNLSGPWEQPVGPPRSSGRPAASGRLGRQRSRCILAGRTGQPRHRSARLRGEQLAATGRSERCATNLVGAASGVRPAGQLATNLWELPAADGRQDSSVASQYVRQARSARPVRPALLAYLRRWGQPWERLEPSHQNGSMISCHRAQSRRRTKPRPTRARRETPKSVGAGRFKRTVGAMKWLLGEVDGQRRD